MNHKIKIMSVLFLALALTAHPTQAQSWLSSLQEFLLKPSTLFIGGLTSLGVYTYHMLPEEKTYALNWVQQTCKSAPPVAWFSAGIFGSLLTYYIVYKKPSNTSKTFFTNPLDNKELKDYILGFADRIKNIESILEISPTQDILGKDTIKKNVIDSIIVEIKAINENIDELDKKTSLLDEISDLCAKQLDKLEQTVFPSAREKNETVVILSDELGETRFSKEK